MLVGPLAPKRSSVSILCRDARFADSTYARCSNSWPANASKGGYVRGPDLEVAEGAATLELVAQACVSRTPRQLCTPPVSRTRIGPWVPAMCVGDDVRITSGSESLRPATATDASAAAASVAPRRAWMWWMLVHRLVLFAVVQGAIAFGLWLVGAGDAWERSIAWWPLTAAITGLCSLALLRRSLHLEGSRYRDLLRFDRANLRSDLRTTLLLIAAIAVLALVPNIGLAALLWGDPAIALNMLVRPLPSGAAWTLLIAFPVAIGLSELPVYFGYVLPRLRRHLGRHLPAILVTAAALSLQHVTLPLMFDWRFVVWRAVMFLPFALVLAVVLDRRPRLLPYLVIVHIMIDAGAAAQVLLASLP